MENRKKTLQLLKVKVAAQEAEVYISLSKPSQTSNSTVNTHMETQMLKRDGILWFKLVEPEILHGGIRAVNLQ